MNLNPYVLALREELIAAADPWGEEARDLAARLAAPMDSAIRLALLEVLSAAAAEVTSDLAPGSVELRLQGRDPVFVVSTPVPSGEADPVVTSEPPAWVAGEGDEASMTRINLRLPQDLKERVEDAARTSGLSVNAWLVRAAAAALPGSDHGPAPTRRARGGDHFTGWVR